MSIVETRLVVGGVDTHADVHVTAALDHVGVLLGVESFPTTPTGYADMHGWLAGFGTVERVGVEGTGAYGAGLARQATIISGPTTSAGWLSLVLCWFYRVIDRR